MNRFDFGRGGGTADFDSSITQLCIPFPVYSLNVLSEVLQNAAYFIIFSGSSHGYINSRFELTIIFYSFFPQISSFFTLCTNFYGMLGRVYLPLNIHFWNLIFSIYLYLHRFFQFKFNRAIASVITPFLILKSKGVSVEKLGVWFTSRT